MAEYLRCEIDTPPSVFEDLMTNWTDEEKHRFNEDWANDDFLFYDEEAKQLRSPMEEALESQLGEGSTSKRVSDSESPSKRLRHEEYFTIESAKQVNVRKFKTTGISSTI